MFPGRGRWHESTVTLPAGAGLLFYTDGAFEGISADGKVISVAAAALLAAGLAGCGSVGDRQTAAATATMTLLTAVQQHDGSSACVLLAPATAAELIESAGKSCPEAILDEDLPAPGTVTSAAVYGQWRRSG